MKDTNENGLPKTWTELGSNRKHCGCANAVWYTMLRDLQYGITHDSREGSTQELLSTSYVLANPDASLVTVPSRKISARYAAAEVLWYLSGTGNIEMIREYAPSYPKWSNDIGSGLEMYGAVGARLAGIHMPGWSHARKQIKKPQPLNQLQAASLLLADEPNTRRCVISLWDAGDVLHSLENDMRNVPCYLSFQYIARDGKLHAITTMRSNDAWLGAPYDIFAFACIQHLLAASIGYSLGSYVHNSGSLHAYAKHQPKIAEVLEQCNNPVPADFSDTVVPKYMAYAARPHGWIETESGNWSSIAFSINTWVAFEQQVRMGLVTVDELKATAVNTISADSSMCRDLALAAATKFLPEATDTVLESLTSPQLAYVLSEEAARESQS